MSITVEPFDDPDWSVPFTGSHTGETLLTIEELEVRFYKFEHDDESEDEQEVADGSLDPLLRALPNLKKLSLRSATYPVSWTPPFIPPTEPFKSLQVLTIEDPGRLRDVLQTLQKLPSLEVLNLYLTETSGTQDFLLQLTSMIDSNKALKSLRQPEEVLMCHVYVDPTLLLIPQEGQPQKTWKVNYQMSSALVGFLFKVLLAGGGIQKRISMTLNFHLSRFDKKSSPAPRTRAMLHLLGAIPDQVYRSGRITSVGIGRLMMISCFLPYPLDWDVPASQIINVEHLHPLSFWNRVIRRQKLRYAAGQNRLNVISDAEPYRVLYQEDV